jgi:hypothetical protein
MTGTQHVVTYKHKFLQYITIKNVLVLFHYKNNFDMNSSSAIWWRHLPVACNYFFEACVSGNWAIFKAVKGKLLYLKFNLEASHQYNRKIESRKRYQSGA